MVRVTFEGSYGNQALHVESSAPPQLVEAKTQKHSVHKNL